MVTILAQQKPFQVDLKTRISYGDFVGATVRSDFELQYLIVFYLEF
jgi:hypothetical protein